jgi:hypothetical protein
MNIQTIAEHSVDLDLLSGGVCIDVGCRGFQFSEAMRDNGCEVWAFDIEDMQVPDGIEFVKGAMLTEYKIVRYVDTKDQQAKFISAEGIAVQGHDLKAWIDDFVRSGKEIDLLKIDAEGSEYFLLSDPGFRPVPKQLSIEFHLHAHRKLHDQYYEACIANLLKHYEPLQHELTQAHGAGWNYWDSLFIRRDLL